MSQHGAISVRSALVLSQPVTLIFFYLFISVPSVVIYSMLIHSFIHLFIDLFVRSPNLYCLFTFYYCIYL